MDDQPVFDYAYVRGPATVKTWGASTCRDGSACVFRNVTNPTRGIKPSISQTSLAEILISPIPVFESWQIAAVCQRVDPAKAPFDTVTGAEQ